MKPVPVLQLSTKFLFYHGGQFLLVEENEVSMKDQKPAVLIGVASVASIHGRKKCFRIFK
jgi:hypothetical protein